MLKKLASIVTAFSLIAAIISSAIAQSEFSVHNWAMEDVMSYVGEGLLPETFTKDLTKDITRGEFAALAVSIYEKKMGEISGYEDSPFSDTDDVYVKKAYKTQIVMGVSEREFMPDKTITRQEMCVMLDRLIAALDLGIVVTLEFIIFDDGGDIAQWAVNAVQLMYKLNIIKGVSPGDAVIAPLNTATREQAIVMAWRLYDNFTKDRDDLKPSGEENDDDIQLAPSNITYTKNNTIAAGDYFTLKINEEGDLVAWGRNNLYQLGQSDNNETRYTSSVAKDVKAVEASGSRGYYIKNDGALFSFGGGKAPYHVMDNVRAVVLSKTRTFAIGEDNVLRAWGSGKNYGLGTGDTHDVSEPIRILENVAKVVSFGDFCAALTIRGDVYQWGDTRAVSEVYVSGDIVNKTPSLIMSGASDISCSGSHLLILAADGSLYGWGSDFSGQLGQGSPGNNTYSAPVKMAEDIVYITAGSEASYAIDKKGILYSCGKNSNGRLGCEGASYDEVVARLSYVTSDAGELWLNHNSVFLKKSAGSIYAWGANFGYALGTGDERDRQRPASVFKDVSQMAFGFDHSVMVKDDGSLYTWGRNEYSQCTSLAGDTAIYKTPLLHSYKTMMIK